MDYLIVATEMALEGKVVELEQQLTEAKAEAESANRWANLYARESQQHWDELMETKLRIHDLEAALQIIASSEVEVFDESEGCNVVVGMDEEEMQQIAREALSPEPGGTEGEG